MWRNVLQTITLATLLTGLARSAHAYVGPGAGISAVGTLVALIGAVLLGIVGFVWYPMKRLLAKGRKAETAKDSRPSS